jgi:PPK2 family polyphosphate:nucleotide phosphotransferase
MFKARAHRFLVPFKGKFRIADCRTKPDKDDRGDKDDKEWDAKLEKAALDVGEWQQKLYSRGNFAMLIILQALDAGGKDGTIRHVFSHINPCGLHVASFKVPSAVEVTHDFLWRTVPHLPARGNVAVFNRSYYEEVLVVRVHPKFLDSQRLADKPSKHFWKERFRAIVEHERHLAEEGTIVLKFWLNISKNEQRKRLLERIDDPSKHWKFNAGDLNERALWDDYMDAYEDCLEATSRPWAPWYAIPADDKPFARLQVAKVINDTFERLDLEFPKPTAAGLAEIKEARARLLSE